MTNVNNVNVLELARVVADAAATIPLFKDLYAGVRSIRNLSDFERLPVTDRGRYAQLTNVAHAVSDPWKMVKPIAPFALGSEEFPLTVLHNDEDKRLLDERLEYLLGRIEAQPSERISILASSPQIYAAADLTESLISLRRPCRVVLRNDYAEEMLHDLLQRLNTRTVICFTGSKMKATAFPSSVRNVVTFNHTEQEQGDFRHFDIFHLDEIPFMAVRQGGREYRCVRDHFVVEYDSDGVVILTTLKYGLMPFIRYRTGFKRVVVEESEG